MREEQMDLKCQWREKVRGQEPKQLSEGDVGKE